MNFRTGKDREGDDYRRLDNAFWNDLREDLKLNNRDVGPAPKTGRLLSAKQFRHLRAWARAYELEGDGVSRYEARRRAFEEFYPNDSKKSNY